MNPKNPFNQQRPIENVKKVLLVGSGKGGVGKSTVSANLALALKAKGQKVGLLDADVYGPSIPRMFGAINQKPPVDENNKIKPIERHGVKLMSMGFLVDESQAVVWRGPILFKAMDQFLRDVDWGELDTLIVDLPPGTGDIALTLAQKVPVAGGITVCTPQNLALADAKKAIDMFSQVQIPMLGIVENMSSFMADESSEPQDLFPRGELNAFIDAKGLEKMSSIPFMPKVASGSEAGFPIMASSPDSMISKEFLKLADKVIVALKD
ncbi:MAG: Mrp/NBP35 family ATP-binding protein [Bdellovibrionales bacterium]|nr:Mrp/NBP35 family ATP-binding protein [Bdellovibrionales bacterium]